MLTISFSRSDVSLLLEIRRRQTKVSQERLATRLGVTRHVYRQVISTKREPNQRTLRFLNVQRSSRGYCMKVR